MKIGARSLIAGRSTGLALANFAGALLHHVAGTGFFRGQEINLF